MEHLPGFLAFLAQGALVTVQVTVMAAAMGVPLAFVVGLMRLSRSRVLKAAAIAYLEIIRGTPLLIQLFYIFFVLPFLGFRINPIPSAVLALSINFAAYESEVVRAGFQAVSRHQHEAAIALNMPRWLAMRRIIFPQAVRIILPPIGNAIIELFKATAIISLVSIHDLTYQGTILTTRTFQTAWVWTLVAGFYFGMSYPATLFARWLERRVAYPS